jgi:hypothetical protein
LYQLPEQYRNYFDSESWKYDARMDWRWNSLARYDWHEHEERVDGYSYFIYRV